MVPIRLDTYLFERGDYPSREQAKRAIMAGEVGIEGRHSTITPGTRVREDERVTVKRRRDCFVSRGGEKLQKALDEWEIDVDEESAIDIGASTGGFTDCLLKNGASRVIAVDVGYGQLDWGLRCDPRVSVLERTNARYIQADELPFMPDLAVVDVSFISLKKLVPTIFRIIAENGMIIALVKPQFEAGRRKVGKGGVIRDSEVHCEVLNDLLTFFQEEDISVKGMIPSPLKGPAGNIEFLLLLRRGEGWPEEDEVRKIVEKAWSHS